MKWVKDRARERSTYEGVGSVIAGLGLIFKINEAPVVVDAIHSVADQAASGDYMTAGGLFLLGLLRILKNERK